MNLKHLLLFFFFQNFIWVICDNTYSQHVSWITSTKGEYVSCMAEEGDTLWVGTANGLLKINKKTEQKISYNTSNSPLPINQVTSLAIDGSGDKWIGTAGGLVKFYNGKWTVYNSSNSPMKYNWINSVIASHFDGSKWITNGNELFKFDETNWTVFNSKNSGLPVGYISKLALDIDGSKWIAYGEGQPKLVKFDDKNWTVYDATNSPISTDGGISALAIDPLGYKWLGTWDKGLLKFDNTNWTIYNELQIPSGISAIGVDTSFPQTLIWYSYQNLLGAIFRFDGIRAEGVQVNNLDVAQVILPEMMGNIIWIGTQSGVAKLDYTHAPVADAGKDQSVTEGSTVVLDGSASSDLYYDPITYHWTAPTGIILSSTNVVKPTFTAPNVSTVTTYTFNLVVNDGSRSQTDQVKITVNPLPDDSGIITGNTNICQGQSAIVYTVPVILNATSYVWSLPTGATGTSTSNVITVNFGNTAISGNIAVKGLNALGDGLGSVLAINVNPIPSTPVITQNGQILYSNITSGNQWYNSGNPIPGATGQDYTITAVGEYFVKVTSNGCVSTSSNVIKDVVTSIDSEEYSNKIKVYPNPVSDNLYILYEGNPGKIQFEIFSISGKIILTGEFRESFTFHTSALQSGIYTIKLKTSDTVEFQKFIKID